MTTPPRPSERFALLLDLHHAIYAGIIALGFGSLFLVSLLKALSAPGSDVWIQLIPAATTGTIAYLASLATVRVLAKRRTPKGMPDSWLLGVRDFLHALAGIAVTAFMVGVYRSEWIAAAGSALVLVLVYRHLAQTRDDNDKSFPQA